MKNNLKLKAVFYNHKTSIRTYTGILSKNVKAPRSKTRIKYIIKNRQEKITKQYLFI